MMPDIRPERRQLHLVEPPRRNATATSDSATARSVGSAGLWVEWSKGGMQERGAPGAGTLPADTVVMSGGARESIHGPPPQQPTTASEGGCRRYRSHPEKHTRACGCAARRLVMGPPASPSGAAAPVRGATSSRKLSSQFN
jgi:hypothetical protein